MDAPRIIYRPEVYEVETLEQAKKITVTAEEGTTTEERWEKETAYLTREIGQRLQLGPDDASLITDVEQGVSPKL